MVMHTFKPDTWEVVAGGSFEFQASLIYKESRTARAMLHREILF